ncbi:unnamed protein product, partial [marine sediment metagenome]
YTPGLYWAYPAVDVDDTGANGIVVATHGGPTLDLGVYYVELPLGGAFGAARVLKDGESTYWDPATPHRWGDYWGCQLDPVDWKTMWFTGQYAASDPANSWKTWIGAASYAVDGILSVSPASGLTTTGPEGGPFDPAGITYEVSNIGGSAVTWKFSGNASWNFPSQWGGELAPGAVEYVAVNLTNNANYLIPGSYSDNYYFTNCYNGASATRNTTLIVGGHGGCEGAVLPLHPVWGPVHYSGSDDQDRGVFVTAIEDF